MRKLAIVGFLAFMIGSIGTFIYRQQLFDVAEGEEIEEVMIIEDSSITNILIKADVASLHFIESEDQQIEVHVSGTSDQAVEDILMIDQQAETLRVEVDQKLRNWFSLLPMRNNAQLKLTIAVPRSFEGHVDARVDVGSIYGKGLMLENLSAEASVGRIEFTQLQLESGRAVVAVGDININQVSGNWYIKTNLGEIGLDLIEWQGEIETRTNIGDIRVQLPDRPDNYSLHLETDLGAIKFRDFVETRSENLGKTYVENVGSHGPNLIVESQIGDIEVDW
ncbi:DUF4097 family beta strand repeat-containing protein [Amphibacillus cookii]|uniref:DUF4097 family beta strand repeat-containing protein n=1 Tax=Amphibacillus cookii TaxID=767787 RepID=UPI001958CCAF|nr:DUF4097 family beta strand repeat-containing protein [Amphibacillus cookii]MBM7540871.1 DUF4097 and DUF4098 domain-containing protein YvlB [Amphibacillus cookii]